MGLVDSAGAVVNARVPRYLALAMFVYIAGAHTSIFATVGTFQRRLFEKEKALCSPAQCNVLSEVTRYTRFAAER
jgi:hypothetical protein